MCWYVIEDPVNFNCDFFVSLVYELLHFQRTNWWIASFLGRSRTIQWKKFKLCFFDNMFHWRFFIFIFSKFFDFVCLFKDLTELFKNEHFFCWFFNGWWISKGLKVCLSVRSSFCHVGHLTLICFKMLHNFLYNCLFVLSF